MQAAGPHRRYLFARRRGRRWRARGAEVTLLLRGKRRLSTRFDSATARAVSTTRGHGINAIRPDYA